MIKNYFKTAWRNLINNKVYSSLNIMGLAAGMAVALLIGLWVNYQYSYDKFLPNNQRLYQVMRNFNSNGDTLTFSTTSLKLAGALRNNIPEFEHIAETDGGNSHGLMVGDKKLYLYGVTAGGDFLKMFRYTFIKGNADAALKEPYSIVLTQSTAEALFGNADPINKMVRLDNHDNIMVTGVIQDAPANSSFQYNYIIPFSFLDATQAYVRQNRAGSFGYNNYSIYTELKPGANFASVSAKIKNIEKSETNDMNAMKSSVILYPLLDWHLYSNFKNGKATSGFIDYVRIFTLIGILVLLIACINFINLSTARSEKRAREVGVRKAIGSLRKDLVLQFLVESALVTFIAFLFSIVLVELSLPAFNSLTGTMIAVPFANPIFWLIVIGCMLTTALLAGSRPAFYLSSFNAVKVLKGAIQVGKSASISRKIMVVTQFSCSIALIISTVIIYRQIEYAKDRPTGYRINHLMTTDINVDLTKNYTALKDELLQSGFVQSVTTSSTPVTNVNSHMDIDHWPGKLAGETVEMGNIQVTADYFKTLGMKIIYGRDFNNSVSDTSNIIYNEAAVKRLRLKDPINQIITMGTQHFRVIGVVKDALMNSPYSAADPTQFSFSITPSYYNIIYQLSPNVKTHQAVEKITQIFDKYNPAFPYTYHFVDADYNQKFSQEVLVGKLSGIFAGLAIFISCLGLFGLAAFVAEQRTKEIGVRKVLGASIIQVWIMLSKDFILLVLISCIIASPLALYFLQKWLMKYDYRISIDPGIFIISAVMAIVITLLTVSFQALKAATTNPVKSLRSE